MRCFFLSFNYISMAGQYCSLALGVDVIMPREWLGYPSTYKYEVHIIPLSSSYLRKLPELCYGASKRTSHMLCVEQGGYCFRLPRPSRSTCYMYPYTWPLSVSPASGGASVGAGVLGNSKLPAAPDDRVISATMLQPTGKHVPTDLLSSPSSCVYVLCTYLTQPRK